MKLQQRLCLIIAPCGICSVILICLVVYSAMGAREKRFVATESATKISLIGNAVWDSDRLAQRILYGVRKAKSIAQVLSSTESKAESSTSASAILTSYLKLQRNAKSLTLITSTGAVRLAVGNSSITGTANQFDFTNLLTRGSPYLTSDGENSTPESTLNTLIYHAPIVQSDSKGIEQHLGWVVYEMDFTSVKKELSDVFKEETVFLNNVKGMTALSGESISTELDHQLNSLSARIAVHEMPSRVEVFDSHGVVTKYSLPGGINLLTYFSDDAVWARLSGLASRLAIATAGGTLLGICSFFALLHLLVLRPLIHVRKSAMTIGLQEYNTLKITKNVTTRSDEIGDLARAIDSTNERLTSTIDELKSSQQENERLAFTDQLTNMPNRRMFQKMADKCIDEAKANNTGLALIFMDLDNFKNINDVLGHSAGDKLLQEVNLRITQSLGFNSTVEGQAPRIAARLGGDEFIFLVGTEAGSNTDDQVTEVAQQLLDSVLKPICLGNTERVISASLGVAQYPEHGQTIESLIASADTAMYEAKSRNKNGFVVYNETFLDAITSKLQMESDLRTALQEGQFHLHYQPKYNLKTLELSGAEALLRWEHPLKGNIPPDQFISAAEESGLINQIGSWVLDEACAQWSSWQNSGLTIDRIAVNVSPLQFASSDFRSIVNDTLERNKCPSSMLEIELTESCVMDAYDEISGTLEQFRKDGISVAIDDFGTGYSSLSLIASMPIDVLKIDRSFVTGLKSNASNEKIVSTVVTLAKQLNLKVVAEGIEEPGELEFLKSVDCDFAQGYFLSKPLSATQMSSVLQGTNQPPANKAA